MRALAVIVLLPIALPLSGLYIGFDTWRRALSWSPLPRSPWLNRIWWWYAYRLGLYKIDWCMRRRANPALFPTTWHCEYCDTDVAMGIAHGCDEMQEEGCLADEQWGEQ